MYLIVKNDKERTRHVVFLMHIPTSTNSRLIHKDQSISSNRLNGEITVQHLFCYKGRVY